MKREETKEVVIVKNKPHDDVLIIEFFELIDKHAQ